MLGGFTMSACKLNQIIRHITSLLFIGLAWVQTFRVKLLNERNYPWEIREDGTYAVKVSLVKPKQYLK